MDQLQDQSMDKSIKAGFWWVMDSSVLRGRISHQSIITDLPDKTIRRRWYTRIWIALGVAQLNLKQTSAQITQSNAFFSKRRRNRFFQKPHFGLHSTILPLLKHPGFRPVTTKPLTLDKYPIFMPLLLIKAAIWTDPFLPIFIPALWGPFQFSELLW